MRTTLMAVTAMSGLLSLSACGGTTPSGDNNAEGLQAALVVAQGGLGDEAYNDLAYEGFQEASAKYGVNGKPIESQDIVAEGEQLVRTAADSGYGLIVDLEFSHAEMLGDVAAELPDTQFAIVNVEVPGDNVTSIVFKEHEGSYLAGVLAALETEDSENARINDAARIGFIGGTKSTGIDKFLIGYQQGARSVNPDIEIDVKYADSFGDAAKGQQIADQMYADGADIIYTVAGGTGAGVIQSAADNNKYAIGVDTDQDGIAKGSVLTSMIKRTDMAISDLIRDYSEDELAGGTVAYGLKEDGVGLSEMKYTKDDIPEEILAEVDAAREEIIAGDVTVWDVTEQGYPDWAK